SIDDAVILERHGQKKPGATGMSIYFPNSQLYRNRTAGAESYAEVATRFAANSLWDDFLAYHYTGRQFAPAEQSLVVPDTTQVVAPGQGAITVSALQVSDDSVDIGETVELSADIEGDNIGYIKFFAGFLDEASNSIYIADTDYLDSGEIREVDGVYYPDWGEGPFTLSFDWEPIVFAIDDGDKRVTALFEPEVYGASADDAVYSVDGIYTYVDGEQYRATMYFNNTDGLMRDVYGFNGSGTAGAPREILPSPGDTFTVLEAEFARHTAVQDRQHTSCEGIVERDCAANCLIGLGRLINGDEMGRVDAGSFDPLQRGYRAHGRDGVVEIPPGPVVAVFFVADQAHGNDLVAL
ncbi:MAG: hypothetical protein P8169_15145, partial [Chloroflexota bacterium]